MHKNTCRDSPNVSLNTVYVWDTLYCIAFTKSKPLLLSLYHFYGSYLCIWYSIESKCSVLRDADP